MSRPFNIKKSIRFAIYHRDACRCVYCNRPVVCGLGNDRDDSANIDHVVSRHDGGSDRFSNLVTSCRRCNLVKSDRGVDTAGRRRDVSGPDAFEALEAKGVDITGAVDRIDTQTKKNIIAAIKFYRVSERRHALAAASKAVADAGLAGIDITIDIFLKG